MTPPVANTSDRELFAATRPQVRGSSPFGLMELGRGHKSAVVGEPSDSRVVAGLRSNEQVVVLGAQVADDLPQLAPSELSSPGGAVAVPGEPAQLVAHLFTSSLGRLM